MELPEDTVSEVERKITELETELNLERSEYTRMCMAEDRGVHALGKEKRQEEDAYFGKNVRLEGWSNRLKRSMMLDYWQEDLHILNHFLNNPLRSIDVGQTKK